MLECNIYKTVKSIGVSDKKIKEVSSFVFKKNGFKKGSVSIHLVGDCKIKSLNKKYRGKNQVTDVISFAVQEGKNFGDKEDLGDIFISVPQVRRQAKELKIKFKEEFLRMLVHGVLHLLGLDHMNNKDAKKMFNLQEKIIERML